MKKMIAVPALLVFLAAGVFAQISFSGMVGSGATILEGTFSGDKLRASGFLWGRLQANAQTKDGTLGGVLRLRTGFTTADDPFSPAYNDPLAKAVPYAWAWWKPVEQVKLQLGFIDAFAVNEIVGWEFNGNDAEDYIAMAGYDYSGDIFPRSTGFYNGTWWTGGAISVYPVKGLTATIAIPYPKGNPADATAADVYKYVHAQVLYNIEGIGRASLTVTGGKDGSLGPTNIADPFNGWGLTFNTNIPTLYGAFLLTALKDRGIGVNVGLAYTFPAQLEKEGNNNDMVKINYYSPLAFGLGLSYTLDKFTVKARFAATFAGSAKTPDVDTIHEPFKLGFGIIPSYDFGICKVYLNTGIAYKGKDEVLLDPANTNDVGKKDGSSAFGWHVNPYVAKTIGDVTLYGGFYFASDSVYGEGSKLTRWGIPVAVQYAF
ncbi:MAG: hypothetical protein FWC45_06985 [Treponema sp.]|nr:hypothetical protein [Treponema sp.]